MQKSPLTKLYMFLFTILFLAGQFIAVGESAFAATATATPTATVTNTPTASPTVTVTNTPTATPTVTVTNTPTASPTATVTSTPTASPTATSTSTPSPTPQSGTVPAYNNEGTSPDANTTVGNFDGGGRSYSTNALSAAGVNSNAAFTFDGVTFTWPAEAAGSNDNWRAAGQVIPVSGSGADVALLGAAAGGQSTGTITIKYSDGTTQQVTVTLSDWTLNGGSVSPATGDYTAVTLPYRNTATGSDKTKTYVFMVYAALTSGKTIASVTLPATVTGGGMHIFTIATGSVTIPPTTLPAYNNEGTSPDTNTTVGNFDGGGRSYSSTALSAAGVNSNAAFTFDGVTFTWPAETAGSNDNWRTAGQVIPVSGSGADVALLGAAAGGQSTGTITIKYSDGTTQQVSVTLSDWTLNGGSVSPATGDYTAVTLPYRNTATGADKTKTYVFMVYAALTSGKTIASVTLPSTVTGGGMHIFTIAAGTVTIPSTTLPAYNNEGTSPDTNTTVGNFDGGGRSYSSTALSAAGVNSNASYTFDGVTFTWPAETAGSNDNWRTAGQVVPVSGSGADVALLGAAAGGQSTGTITITYSDGTTQQVSVTLSDWTLNGGSVSPATGDYTAVTLPYRNTATGADQTKTYVFMVYAALTSGKTIVSVTLPATVTGGGMHIFAIASGTVNIPPTNLPAYNSEGTSPDTNTTVGNFDGGGRSYSINALSAAGINSGASLTVDGISFAWPKEAAGSNDNWSAAGQVIPVSGSGSELAFLGGAVGGKSSGTVTITYTDGTTQTATLEFTDWAIGGGASAILPDNTIAAYMTYRNTATGQQYLALYLFMAYIPVTSGKTVATVTLPTTLTGGGMHIFAVSQGNTPNVPAATSNQSLQTYLGGNTRSSYFPNETQFTSADSANIAMQWAAKAGGAANVQPLVVNNVLYWGTWDGVFHATNLSGVDIWTQNLGVLTVSTCAPPSAGIAGTATYGSVNGTAAIFVGGGDGNFYALNASTGAILWKTMIAPPPANFIWDSPAVYNGSVFIGISSFGDCPDSQGMLDKLDINTGTIQSVFDIVPATCTGGGMWGSPAIDTATGIMYIATGNQNLGTGPCTDEPYAQAVVAINTTNMTAVGSWQIMPSTATGDSDFGSTPTLFTATINGVVRQLVGVGNKNGLYYTFDRTNITAGPIWSTQVAIGGDCPDCGNGTISPSVFDGNTLYIAAGQVTVNGVTYSSNLMAVNPATGAIIWRTYFFQGYILSAVSAVKGVLFTGVGNSLVAINAANGALLYQYIDTSTAYSLFYGAPAVVNNVVYATNYDGTLFSFTVK